MKNNNVAVVVNSCDSYDDLWDYTFAFFKANWSDCPYKIYLNTETKSYKSKDVDVTVVNTNKKYSWSKRLKRVLKSIEEEYVIIICEDFFFYDKVRQDILNNCEKWLKGNKKIGCFNFENNIDNQFNTDSEFDNFRIKDKKERYYISAYASMWRKSFLMELLSNNENAWEFEAFGAKRALHYKYKNYIVKNGGEVVFPCWIKGENAYGVTGGKWTKGNVELFNRYGLQCDFSKRGFFNQKESEAGWVLNPKLSFFQKITLPITNRELFKKKMRPRIKRITSKIDLKGRLKNLFRRG